MNNDHLISMLLEINAIKIGDFTLKSGKQSPIYIDMRPMVSYPEVLLAVADAVWTLAKTAKFDRICGVPYTALPIATCVSVTQKTPMLMLRKERKAHGTKQLLEGNFQTGQTCLVIEDVVTTGGSILNSIKELEGEGLIVKNVVAFLDRDQGGQATINAAGYEFTPVLKLAEVIAYLKAKQYLNEQQLAMLASL